MSSLLALPTAAQPVLGAIWTFLSAASALVWAFARHPGYGADHQLSARVGSWWWIIGILPLERQAPAGGHDPLAALQRALERADILLIFPEGTRGEPEIPGRLKPGVAHLARRVPVAPVIPVHMEGLGKVLPRGEGLLVPFVCDVWIGEPVFWKGEREEVMRELETRLCPQQAIPSS
jgi:1-acyl-sn-glycerol-3-phosphate acyltransferase